jgi:hypothetical protein
VNQSKEAFRVHMVLQEHLLLEIVSPSFMPCPIMLEIYEKINTTLCLRLSQGTLSYAETPGFWHGMLGLLSCGEQILGD